MNPNENDEVFTAEADIDGRESHRSCELDARSAKSTGMSPAPLAAEEDTPLLGGRREEARSDADSNAESEPVEWFGTAEIQGLPWWKRPSIYWLLPPFLLFTTAFGGIVVPKLNLITDLICNDYYATGSPSNQDPISGPVDPGNRFDRCRDDAITSRASLFLLYASVISGLLSGITSPKLGALSDRYGRKNLLIIVTTGALFGEVLTILAAKYPETFDVNWILVGYAIDGLAGSFIVGMALAHAYASDCTPPQKRNVAFAYFHACLFTGIAIGPVLAGYLIKTQTPVIGKTEAVLLVFYIALGCHIAFILFLLLFIPESLSKGRQEAAREKHRLELERLGPSADWINQLRSINLLRPLRVLYPTGPGSSPAVRRNLVLLAATDMIVFSVAMGALGVITLYLRNQFGWEDWESSKYVSIVNSSRVIALLVLLPAVTRLVRGKQGTKNQRSSGSDLFDLSIIRVAIFFDMLGYLGFALVRDGNLFIVSGAIASVGGIGSPALGSALTKHVPPDRVGQLLGATGLLHAFARVIGPILFNGIFSATVHTFKQTVFVCLAATFGLAFICSWFIRPHVYLEELEPDGSMRVRPEFDEDEQAAVR
ncbi:MFS general substrate transporter [Lophiostoma macrostomum CBS 122681]|uniref:MFS general substrate transporter n=1 Tax=Lophiostoma macrostomum CBS 122681 TaxID=1314788 RepID=A0A6A6SZ83_9PLEO|nr:MFS general substrate transporter [Lophiostoma macrostomum CBS 122681]